ncbi:clan AA aspartic protease [Cryomorpha ignava]|uniref:Clan AA aspartic protease n=1 Tax=Cryomorpha ignava TaxID=101383 RepID=A0A7K3WUW1_9FLAO|nr:retropepsin-like aspartic protease [Cryomorpha ignava]NEN24455.1 clan AA aspartic protease [Cryomorpha ignava]
MSFYKPLGVLLAVSLLLGCTNFRKLYKDGSVGSNQFYAEVRYDSTLDLIFLPVEIQGETYRFLFDTGAPNVISKELRDKLAIKSKGKGKVGDSQGNSDKLGVVKLDTVSIGGVYFYDTSAIVADLNRAVEIQCLKIDGIIGANLMKFAYWKIDSKKRVLTLSSNLDTLKQSLVNPHILQFKAKKTFTPVVSLWLNDSLVENITYDTGSGGYISLGKSIELKTEDFIAEFSGYGSTGLFGSKLDTIRYGRISVGLDSLKQIGIAEYSQSNYKKLLGMEYLEQFVQILDWDKNQITLFEDELVSQKFNQYPVSPRWVDGNLIVGGLNTDTAYHLVKLSIGDTIKMLGNRNFENVDVSAYCDVLNLPDSIKSDTLKIELMDGNSYHIPRATIYIE